MFRCASHHKRLDMRKMTKATILGVIFAVLVYKWYWRQDSHGITLGNLEIEATEESIQLTLDGRDDRTSLRGELGVQIPRDNRVPVACGDADCLLWPGLASFTVARRSFPEEGVTCHLVDWESLTADRSPKDCYDMTGALWYGGPEVTYQSWPINGQQTPQQPFWSVDYLMHKHLNNRVGPIVEPYWLSSQGVAIYVEDNRVPLHVSVNENGDRQLCLSATWNGTKSSKHASTTLAKLSYMICQGDNVREVHSFMARNFIARPQKLPDKRVLKDPIWSTWARYKMHVSQEKVMSYADEIEKYEFPHSQIEIDDMYTTTYGDFTFDAEKFPDARKMTDELHARGFRITAWLVPFANLDSEAFQEGLDAGYWISDSTGTVPGLVRWWQGVGAVLDVTNPIASDWFLSRLRHLKDQAGLDSFKFDAGEVGHLPQYLGTHIPLDKPNLYTTYYANMLARMGDMVEMRSAYRTQSLSIFTRIMDKDSDWGAKNGLPTIIPTVLSMSITGYHFILPDMIGGNGYSSEDGEIIIGGDAELPDKELYIRWVELTAYLPSMQFSYTPWQYDEQVIRISRDMVHVHQERVFPRYIKAAQEMLQSGTPIIRPVWWLDPEDETALSVESEFLLGADLLVAPVVAKGARSRDVYLPRGTWQDDLRGERVLGPVWLRDYRVDLDQVATFTFISN